MNSQQHSFSFLYQFHYRSVFNVVTRGQQTTRTASRNALSRHCTKRESTVREKPLWKNRIVRCATHLWEIGTYRSRCVSTNENTHNRLQPRRCTDFLPSCRFAEPKENFRETNRVTVHRHPSIPPDSYRTSEKEAPPLECRSSANIDDREGLNQVNDTRWLSLP